MISPQRGFGDEEATEVIHGQKSPCESGAELDIQRCSDEHRRPRETCQPPPPACRTLSQTQHKKGKHESDQPLHHGARRK